MKTSFPKVSLAVLAVAIGFGFSASAQQQGRIVSIQGGRLQGGSSINILGPNGTANRPNSSRPDVGVTTTITISNGRYFESNVMSLSRGQHAFSSFMTSAGIALLNANSGKETLIISGLQSFDTSAINTGILYLSCGAVVDINRRIVDTTKVIDGCASSPNDGLAFWTGAKIDTNGNLSTLPSFVTGVRFSFEGTVAGRDTVLVSVANLQRVVDECKSGTKGSTNADTAMNLAIASTALSGGAAVTGIISTGIEIGRATKQGDNQDKARAAVALQANKPLVAGTPQYNLHNRVVEAFEGKLDAERERLEAAHNNDSVEDFAKFAVREAGASVTGNNMGTVTQSCIDRGFNFPRSSETNTLEARLNYLQSAYVKAFEKCSGEFFKNQANAQANVGQHHLIDQNNYAGSAVLSGLTALLATGGAVTSGVNIAFINKVKDEFEELYAARVSCANAVNALVNDIEFHPGSTTATRR